MSFEDWSDLVKRLVIRNRWAGPRLPKITAGSCQALHAQAAAKIQVHFFPDFKLTRKAVDRMWSGDISGTFHI